MRLGVRRAVWVVLAIASAAGGYAVGLRQGRAEMIRSLQVEAAGNLTQRIETLSQLRLGDAPAAILQLEGEADQLAESIARNAGADRRVLSYYKTYLTVAPPSPARAKSLSMVLDGVPTLDPSQCKTALQALLLFAKAGPAERGR